jgi:hypothetical protein
MNKAEQKVVEIVELEPWKFLVRSSNKLTYYEIIKRRDESFSCACPSFKYNGGECKHIQAVKAMIGGD